jgi:aminopeptidase N
MLHNYLGAEHFRNGLQHYLKTFAYKNAVTTDLWQALEEASGKPVMSFMNTWTSKGGYPLLSVSTNKENLVCEQQRFVINPKSPARNDKTIWPIPLLADELSNTLLEKRRTVITLPNSKKPLLLNQGLTGFYRVDYSHELQKLQTIAIKDGTISDIDRMGLLSDGFEVTKAGYQPITEYLDLLENFYTETKLPVWEIIASSLSSIRHTLAPNDTDDSLREAMKPFVLSLTKNELTRLGWSKHPDEKHLDSLLRPIVISLAASADEPQTLQSLQKLYDQKIYKNGSIDPDLRATVYVTAARTGGQKEYDELLACYKATQSSDEKLSITAAMTSFQQPELHKQILALLKTDTIRTQDLSYWIAYSFMNRHSRRQTWKWLQQNWAWLKEVIGTDLGFARIPVYVARNFSDISFLDEYKQFFDSKMEPLLKRSYEQGYEIIETNIDWHKRDAKAALEWFKSRQK